jgi:hypothetical protein
MMAGSIETTATAISKRVGVKIKTGFDPILAISIAQLILGFLGDCVKHGGSATPGGASNYAETIADHYNPDTDTFEESLMGPVRAHTRRAIRMNFRHNGGPRPNTFSQEYVEAQSHETLKELMSTPSAAVSCLAEINN